MDAGHVSENALYCTFIQTSKFFKMESVAVVLKFNLLQLHIQCFFQELFRDLELSLPM